MCNILNQDRLIVNNWGQVQVTVEPRTKFEAEKIEAVYVQAEGSFVL